jgi:uncharacterized protein
MIILAALALSFLAPQVTYPPRPAQGEFILDEAKILKADDAAAIRKVAGELYSAKQVSIVVVTIPSLATHGAGSWQMQRYAMKLMAEWAVGNSSWNYGMLLLVSPGDRKARIELGAAWGHLRDAEAQRIMTEDVVPQFKRGEMSAGILSGVQGLRDLAQAEIKGEPVPQVYGPAPVRPAPSQPPIVVPPPPYRSVRNNWVPDTSTTSFGGCFVIGLIILVGIVVVVGLGSMFRGMGTSTWGGAPGGVSPGLSAFGGGCLGAGLGNWFGGGSYSRWGYWDDPWDRPWGGGWFGGGSSRVDHYHHYDSSSDSSSSSGGGSDGSWGSSDSSSGSSDSSSSGGGFSGGGGASGEW